MKLAISAFISGLIFASGLAVSGMTNPQNVIGFLDITGTWRPALMFVMVGAIFVYAICYRFIMKRSKPIYDNQFHVPGFGNVDRNLIFGSAIFGIGWGVGGYCPGPALTSLGAGAPDSIVFVVFMLIGMGLHRIWEFCASEYSREL